MVSFISYMRPSSSRLEEVAVLCNAEKPNRELRKMKKQKNMFQAKEQDKISEKDLNEMKLSGLPDKEYKIMALNMLTELERKWLNKVKNLTKRQKT